MATTRDRHDDVDEIQEDADRRGRFVRCQAVGCDRSIPWGVHSKCEVCGAIVCEDCYVAHVAECKEEAKR